MIFLGGWVSPVKSMRKHRVSPFAAWLAPLIVFVGWVGIEVMKPYLSAIRPPGGGRRSPTVAMRSAPGSRSEPFLVDPYARSAIEKTIARMRRLARRQHQPRNPTKLSLPRSARTD